MSERQATIARLRSPDVATTPAPSGVTVSRLETNTSYVLRLAPALAERIGASAGIALAGDINTAATSGERIAARLGPDEWLLMAPADDHDALEAAVGQALAGQHHSLVDVSHRNVVMVVAGQQAAGVLNAGVALDLDDAAFPAGSATRTVLGKAEIILIRPGSERRYYVVAWRTFTPYVQGFLDEAARNADVD